MKQMTNLLFDTKPGEDIVKKYGLSPTKTKLLLAVYHDDIVMVFHFRATLGADGTRELLEQLIQEDIIFHHPEGLRLTEKGSRILSILNYPNFLN